MEPSPHSEEMKIFSPSISIDIPVYVEKILCFLHKVHQNPSRFNCEPSVYNYFIEHYLKFLSLKEKYPEKEIIPSLDVEWVWYCHLIRPKFYHAYCKRNFGKIIDHTINDWIKGDMDPHALNETAALFEREFGETYISEKIPQKTKEIKYLETADIYKDWTWYDEILHYSGYPRDHEGIGFSTFMETAYHGYLDFLIRVRKKGFLCGPTVNIDLFWHTHLGFPLVYVKDCEIMFGEVVYHMPLGTVARWNEFQSVLTVDLVEDGGK